MSDSDFILVKMTEETFTAIELLLSGRVQVSRIGRIDTPLLVQTPKREAFVVRRPSRKTMISIGNIKLASATYRPLLEEIIQLIDKEDGREIIRGKLTAFLRNWKISRGQCGTPNAAASVISQLVKAKALQLRKL